MSSTGRVADSALGSRPSPTVHCGGNAASLLAARMPDMTDIPRRTVLASTAGLALTGFAGRAGAAPLLTRHRLSLPTGVQSGDVTTSSAVLWARSSGPGRLVAEVRSGRRFQRRVGQFARPATDFTAKLMLHDLAPGREYEADLFFEDDDGNCGESQRVRF